MLLLGCSGWAVKLKVSIGERRVHVLDWRSLASTFHSGIVEGSFLAQSKTSRCLHTVVVFETLFPRRLPSQPSTTLQKTASQREPLQMLSRGMAPSSTRAGVWTDSGVAIGAALVFDLISDNLPRGAVRGSALVMLGPSQSGQKRSTRPFLITARYPRTPAKDLVLPES